MIFVAVNFDMTARVEVDEDMNQRDIVLEHLRQYSTITPLEGLSKYGIGNVQGRIADLRLKGHQIATYQDGPRDWATYKLIQENNDNS